MTDLATLGATLMDADAIAVLSVPEGSTLPDRLAAVAGTARVFAHTPFHPALARPGHVHVALAADDRDIPDRRAALWPGAGARVLRRERRIDTLYGDRRIGLIVLAEQAGAGVLAGAAASLARERPMILRPGDAALAPPQPDTLTVAFDATPICAGLHPPEYDNPRGGRWTGAAASSWFLMPRPDPGAWRLRLSVADWGSSQAGFCVRIDGQTHAPSLRGAMTADFAPITIVPSGQPLHVRLLTAPAARDMQRGPRRIGVRLLRASFFRLNRHR